MTARRTHISRWLSPSLFALIALCFALPFATVSCDGATTTFTGVQLVTHAVPRGGILNEAPDCRGDISGCVEQQGSTIAGIALAAALLGAVLGVLGVVRGPGWCAAVGFGALVVLPFRGPFLGPDIEMHDGWGYALALCGVVGLLHMRCAWRRWRARRHAARVAAHAVA